MMNFILRGAVAKLSIAYHSKLDMNLYIRITLECYHMMPGVSGFDQVCEVEYQFQMI